MKKKKQNREEFRSEIAAKLSEHIRRNGMRKADAARALGISRQRLHSYLKKKMTPSSDFLCDVAQKWDIEFIYRGRSFAAGAFKEAR